MNDTVINDIDIRNLVIERIKVLPSGKRISVGRDVSYSRDEIVDHINSKDKIGQTIIQAQIEFLRSMKTGVLFDE